MDTIEYSGFQYSVSTDTYLSDGDIQCHDPKSVESFTYTFMHFYELWFIYGAGLLLSFMVNIYNIYTKYTQKKKGKFVLQGVRAHRDKYPLPSTHLILSLFN